MHSHSLVRPFLALAFGSALGACALPSANTGGDDGGPHEELRAQLVHSVAYRAVAPSFAAFQVSADALTQRAETYAASIGGEQEAQALDDVRAAWLEAMQAWQVIEMMQLGPVGPSSTAIGGADRRDEIYSWPSVNTCRVDQELVLAEYGSNDFISSRLVNTYGLDALEYLLFNASMENTCAPQLEINTDGQWEALGEPQITARRAAYAAALAHALASEAASLATTWSVNDGEFTVHLADPRASTSPYQGLSKALDEIVRAMFYLDLVVKDAKVGVPAGALNCDSAPCISELESNFARASKEEVVANLEGFKLLYFGGSEPSTDIGFDDLLVAFDARDTADKVEVDIEIALSSCGTVSPNFAEALLADPTALDACHAAIRELTDVLKGDFATVLMLTIPSEAAGDAD